MKPSEPEAKLERYEELLRLWASRIDLVSRADLSRLRSRHIDDSLRAVAAVETAPPGPCIDVGSGAGLPGIPLAIVTGRAWRLLEPRRQRAGFLDECLRELDLQDGCEVVRLTAAQAAATGLAGVHAVATARALATPPVAAARCRPLVAPGGLVVLFTGPTVEIPSDAEEIAPGLLTIRSE